MLAPAFIWSARLSAQEAPIVGFGTELALKAATTYAGWLHFKITTLLGGGVGGVAALAGCGVNQLPPNAQTKTKSKIGSKFVRTLFIFISFLTRTTILGCRGGIIADYTRRAGAASSGKAKKPVPPAFSSPALAT
jgi:hypothetical protein